MVFPEGATAVRGVPARDAAEAASIADRLQELHGRVAEVSACNSLITRSGAQ